MSSIREITYEEWVKEGTALFGTDRKKWRFVCPCCGHVATPQDWLDAGATEGEIAFSCVGRRSDHPREAFGKGNGPCNYAGGGFFKLNPVQVTAPDGRVIQMFEFDRGAQ